MKSLIPRIVCVAAMLVACASCQFPTSLKTIYQSEEVAKMTDAQIAKLTGDSVCQFLIRVDDQTMNFKGKSPHDPIGVTYPKLEMLTLRLRPGKHTVQVCYYYFDAIGPYAGVDPGIHNLVFDFQAGKSYRVIDNKTDPYRNPPWKPSIIEEKK